jgi:hypothetical protein
MKFARNLIFTASFWRVIAWLRGTIGVAAVLMGMSLCAPANAFDPIGSAQMSQETPEERKARISERKKQKKAQIEQKRAEQVAQAMQTETSAESCGGDCLVYPRSKSRIRVISSKAFTQELNSLKTQSDELARVRKAISIADELVQDHVNDNLYLYGKFPLSKNSKQLNDLYDYHWNQIYKDKMATSLDEFRKYQSERREYGINNYRIEDSYKNIICPIVQRTTLRVNQEKYVIQYKFLHVAYVAFVMSEIYGSSKGPDLNLDNNGKSLVLEFVLNKEFKYLPFDGVNSGWWYSSSGSVRSDASVPFRQTLLDLSKSEKKSSPNPREHFQNLVAKFDKAASVCNKPNLFN